MERRYRRSMSFGETQKFMRAALDCARDAASRGAVPVGAVIVKDGAIICQASNNPHAAYDPTGHAEINAIRMAADILQTDRLTGCDLWVTLEPCAMCAGAIAHARIRRLYYAASDPKGGAIENGPRLFSHSTIHHKPEIYSGMCEDDAAQLLQQFFQQRR